MGYRVLDICYPTTADALIGFQQSFPQGWFNGFYSLESSSINSTGLITYTLRNSSNVVTSAQVTQLPTCTTPSSFKNTPIRDMGDMDMLVIVAFIFAILIGFGHGISLKGFGK